jgi:hypothetical protein
MVIVTLPCRYDGETTLTIFFSACFNQPVCRCLRSRRAEQPRRSLGHPSRKYSLEAFEWFSLLYRPLS